MNPPEQLGDDVVLLRALRDGDREAVLETMRDPVIRRWLNMPADPSDADFDELLALVRAGWASGERIDFTVTAPPDDRALGAVVASRRARDNWEIAYLAGERGRGRGLMTRAARLVCDWLFAEGVGRIELRTSLGNEASQRLAERLGFVPEGRERRSIWLDGQRQDALVWSLLPDDPR